MNKVIYTMSVSINPDSMDDHKSVTSVVDATNGKAIPFEFLTSETQKAIISEAKVRLLAMILLEKSSTHQTQE